MKSGYHKLKTACCVAVLTLGLAACGGGQSDADVNAAAAAAREEANAAAAVAAAAAAAAAEAEKQAAVAAAEEAAAAATAAAAKMARATVQKAAIADAITKAQTALGMVVLGASDADLTAAGEAIQAITTAIEAAADVDDTSMYSAQVTLLDGSLAAATGFVHQDRAAKKMARADMQQGAIAAAIAEAEAAVANVDGATDEEIEAAAMAAGEKVQAVREAIAAAVDVDDTSMYTTQVDGLDASLGTATDMAKSAYQSGAIMAALLTANSAVDVVALGATDEEIEAAATAVQAAKDAIAKAVDVDDTSMYTAQVDGLETSLTKATELVQQDRDAKMMARAYAQKGAIAAAIANAEAAVALVVDGASDEVIAAAEKAVQDARDAIAAAVDVDDTSMDTATVNGLASGLIATKIAVLTSRAAQETIDTQLAEQRTMATDAMEAAKIAADNARRLPTMLTRRGRTSRPCRPTRTRACTRGPRERTPTRRWPRTWTPRRRPRRPTKR